MQKLSALVRWEIKIDQHIDLYSGEQIGIASVVAFCGGATHIELDDLLHQSVEDFLLGIPRRYVTVGVVRSVVQDDISRSTSFA
jgi:hypothetical protein